MTAHAPQNPMHTQIGGSHYKTIAIQPAEFWIKNQLPAVEGAITKYLTRHSIKNGCEDLRKAIHFAHMLEWWHFDAPPHMRVVPQHLRGHRSWAINPFDYCAANHLPPLETAAINAVCGFTAREHLSLAITDMQSIVDRDYSHGESALTRSDIMYLAKEQLEHYLSVLETTACTDQQRARVEKVIALIDKEWRQ